jgi:hypothetical protein
VFAKSLPVGKFVLAAVVKQGDVAPTGENVLFVGPADAQYAADTTCGHTRTSLANWSTRISAIHP